MIHDTLNISAFRAMWPAFSSATTYPDAMLNLWYGAAGSYINQSDNLTGLNGAALDLALQLLLAHMLTMGGAKGVITSSTIGGITVALQAPPAKTGFQHWLSVTPYGLKLWGLLSAKSAGGWSVGGGPESFSFRKTGGFF